MKRTYKKPVILRIKIDRSISLIMMTGPINPDPRGGGKKGADEPFKSPFGDKPFS